MKERLSATDISIGLFRATTIKIRDLFEMKYECFRKSLFRCNELCLQSEHLFTLILEHVIVKRRGLLRKKNLISFRISDMRIGFVIWIEKDSAPFLCDETGVLRRGFREYKSREC